MISYNPNPRSGQEANQVRTIIGHGITGSVEHIEPAPTATGVSVIVHPARLGERGLVPHLQPADRHCRRPNETKASSSLSAERFALDPISSVF